MASQTLQAARTHGVRTHRVAPTAGRPSTTSAERQRTQLLKFRELSPDLSSNTWHLLEKVA